jgi:hypothetical protein
MTASDAVEREGRLRCADVSISERIDELLLRLTIIERLARGALPEKRLAGLPPEAHAELVEFLAEGVREAVRESQCKSRVVH